jgi:hypothetical protein
MTFYDICLQYETPEKAIVITNCYENKKKYRCKYNSDMDQKIAKYLEIFEFHKQMSTLKL